MERTNEDIELLRNCGREVAEGFIRSAVQDAENEDQMNNQIATLHYAAVHILAAEMYNQSRQMDISPEEFISSLDTELRYELKHYADQDLELAGQNPQ